MKKLIAILAVLSASSAFGQCPTGNCARVYYAPIMPRYQTVQPCQTVQQVAPCQAAQPVAEPVEACAPVATIEPCAPVETCAPTETSAESVLKIKEIDECTGACPLRSAAKAAVKTATAPVRAVANLLASANATRDFQRLCFIPDILRPARSPTGRIADRRRQLRRQLLRKCWSSLPRARMRLRDRSDERTRDRDRCEPVAQFAASSRSTA